MVVTSSNGITQSIADGIQKDFVFDFKIASVNPNFETNVEASISVYLLDSDEQIEQELGVDYTVDVDSQIVSFVEAPLDGELVTITLEPPRLQETAYTEGGRFPALSHEGGLDELDRNIISSQTQLDRSIKLIASHAIQTEITIVEGVKDWVLAADTTTKQFVLKPLDSLISDTSFHLQPPINPNALVKIIDDKFGTSAAISDIGGVITVFDDSITFSQGGRDIALGFDLLTGTYTAAEFSIDDSTLAANQVLGVTGDGTKLTFSPVENTGGIGMEAPIVDRITKVLNDGAITSTPFFQRQFLDRETLYAEQLETPTEIVFYKDDDNFVTLGAETGRVYSLSFDISEEANTGSVLELIKDSEVAYRVSDRQPLPSELLHVNPAGGTPQNTPTFIGHQEIEPEKFVDDSALTSGGGNFIDLTLESVNEALEAESVLGTAIVSGVLTLNVRNSNIFFVPFVEDVTSLVIENALDGNHFVLILETRDTLGNAFTWAPEFLFEDGIAWQSSATAGEVDILMFKIFLGEWYVDPLADAMEYTVSQVIGVETEQGGNVSVLSGDGTVVLATGSARVEDDVMQSVVVTDARELQEADAMSASSIVAGVVDIDLDVARVWEVDVDEDITEINITNSFSQGEGQQFFVKFNETDNDYTYGFGSDFLHENGTLPSDSVSGQLKGYVFSWFPSIQRWFSIRYF